MSTKSSILFHFDEKARVNIHIYEEALEDPPANVYLEVRTEHAIVTVPWPVGLTNDEVLKLAVFTEVPPHVLRWAGP